MGSTRVDNFTVGMRMDFRDATKRPEGSYPLGVNVRSRSNTITPVADPVDVTRPGWLNLQGCMGMGDWIVAVADGYAWVADSRQLPEQWVKLTGYRLNPLATEVWMETVSVATLAYTRQMASTNKKGEAMLVDTIPQFTNGFYSSQGGGLPCMVIQDGTSRPMLVHPEASGGTFTCRKARNYEDWTPENPEYVPIGYQMQRVGNVLYIIGKSPYAFEDKRIIFRSVSGRMLDFMVNIKMDGSKELLEADGGARTVSHAVDFDEVRCISRVAFSESAFLVSTASRSWIVQPDFNSLIFGEPQFKQDAYVGPVGAVSQYSITDIVNDAAIIGPNGIRSFNAVSQLKNKAEHTVLSAPVNDLFRDIIQTSGATCSYQNYSLFGVTTKYGPAILVYDNNPTEGAPNGRFVSLDIFSAFNDVGKFGAVRAAEAPIKQFASTEGSAYQRLYCRAGNKLLRLYEGTTYSPKLYIGDFYTGDSNIGIEGQNVVMTFVHNPANVDVNVDVLVDGRYAMSCSQNLIAGEPLIDTLPFGSGTNNNYCFTSHNIQNNARGHKIGLYISWNNAAELSAVDFTFDTVNNTAYATGYHQ